jgi:hypothetical protein
VRTSLRFITHPLTWLSAALGWNYIRSRLGWSTVCSTSRENVGPVAFTLGWAALTAWFIPHYVRPFFKGNR